MKLAKSEQERLQAALDVALGIVPVSDADTDELGFGWYRPDEDEVRRKCRDVILGSIIKASDAEPKEQLE